MINKLFIKGKIDELLGEDLLEMWGQQIILKCPDLSGVIKFYPLNALIGKPKDANVIQESYNSENNKIIKIFIKDIEALRLAGNQIPLSGFKNNKSTIKMDNEEYAIKSEGIKGNRRMLVFECTRTS